ncbi:uncharacterized protein LOC106472976 [Limulus polyphemus]|uniref:Uncharacterized protein LOC106472976 n=1 Tax=Limulus polyphemus TaxID=6850 RepID=A0ABM1TMV0_LIMPO|nr:uncharacterized protein LOC106472976 [Limulus polyphemus]XP_022257206.1 uncharacterized protein LOC106472976 [Limulus polyphemus]
MNAVWNSNPTNDFVQIYFPCESGKKADEVIGFLRSRGVGVKDGSFVGSVPCSVYYHHHSLVDEFCKKSTAGENKTLLSSGLSEFWKIQEKFLKSITSTLTVTQVVEGLRESSRLSFDYVMFVILASVLASLGLLEDSSVIMVSSMLLSPLMDPIAAGTFGFIISDHELRNMGLISELIGLGICTVFGFLFGITFGNIYFQFRSHSKLLTQEILSRCEWRGLWVGLLTALPSGAGVALSLLAGNAGSLVGVGISASLLGPAVNAGLLWAFALIASIKEASSITRNSTVNYHTAVYFASSGLTSFLLTVVNIVCIILSAICMLRIKQVIPTSSRFWKEDLKVAEEHNKRISGVGRTVSEEVLHEWAKVINLDENRLFEDTPESQKIRLDTLRDIVEDVEKDDVYQSVLLRFGGRKLQPLSKRLSEAVATQWRNTNAETGSRKTFGRRRSTLRWSSYTPQVMLTGDTVSNNELGDEVDMVVPDGAYKTGLRRALLSSPNPYSLWPSIFRDRYVLSSSEEREGFRRTISPSMIDEQHAL